MTWAAILAKSPLPPKFLDMYSLVIMARVAPTQTREKVLSPAGLPFISRSNPISPPQIEATIIRNSATTSKRVSENSFKSYKTSPKNSTICPPS